MINVQACGGGTTRNKNRVDRVFVCNDMRQLLGRAGAGDVATARESCPPRDTPGAISQFIVDLESRFELRAAIIGFVVRGTQPRARRTSIALKAFAAV